MAPVELDCTSGSNTIFAVCPIYFSHFPTLIRTVERRLELDTLDTAVTTHVSVFSSSMTETISPTNRLAARLVSTSRTICGIFHENSAIGEPILTDCPILAITLDITPSTGVVIRSFA